MPGMAPKLINLHHLPFQAPHFFLRHKKLTQPMDPEKNSFNFIFPTKYVIPKSLKFGHWLSEKKFEATLFFKLKRVTPYWDVLLVHSEWMSFHPL